MNSTSKNVHTDKLDDIFNKYAIHTISTIKMKAVDI